MYYLAKFCRICIKSNVELIDIESDDGDNIKLSQKLKECTEIVISNESLSTKICTQCVKKLKVSYDFHEMCKNSSKLLQGILSELVSDSDKITTENFTNSELRVTLLPLKLPQDKTQERSVQNNGSILKSLLSCENATRNTLDVNISTDSPRGGLRNIIAFTRSFDFGYTETNESSITFHSTVLYIIENHNYLEDEDEMFETVPEEFKQLQFEEVIIEPDIRIKTELMEEQPGNETTYDENDNLRVKTENVETFDQDCFGNVQYHTKVPFIDNIGLLNKLYCHRTFSQNSIRCRTRGNPYINPQLKNQFMLRSFQCKKCPRYFKTPGYLKAHCAKVHNAIY